MVKWKDSWLEAEDSNCNWGKMMNITGYCKLRRCQVKYNTQAAQAFTQHSQKKKLILGFQLHRCIFQEKQNLQVKYQKPRS